MKNKRRHYDPRFLPNYSYAEAALYLDLPVSTVRSWTRGTGSFKPIIEPPVSGIASLSFINLVEMYVLGAVRRAHQVSMPRVRKAIGFAERRFRIEHPLAVLDLCTDDRDLFADLLGRIVDMSGSQGQTAIREVVGAHLARIERGEDRFAERFFPFSRSGFDPSTVGQQPRCIVIDPRIAFGRPVISGTGIPTRAVAERFRAGESFADLALDYGCRNELIEEAIRYEQQVAA
jgi:uncharacterized protein (DUF433 family)